MQLSYVQYLSPFLSFSRNSKPAMHELWWSIPLFRYALEDALSCGKIDRKFAIQKGSLWVEPACYTEGTQQDVATLKFDWCNIVQRNMFWDSLQTWVRWLWDKVKLCNGLHQPLSCTTKFLINQKRPLHPNWKELIIVIVTQDFSQQWFNDARQNSNFKCFLIC